MPELPEVEVLVRHLAPRLVGRSILSVNVCRSRVLAPTSIRSLTHTLRGARFVGLRRRAKYLVFNLHSPKRHSEIILVGHLGMTGRMYLLPCDAPLPKHAAAVLDLDRGKFVFEDTRYFGRLTLDVTALGRLGMEPLEAEFTPERFAEVLKRSAQPIKVKLLDQSAVAGVGNIYASEALFRAGISPSSGARFARFFKRPLSAAAACLWLIPAPEPKTGCSISVVNLKLPIHIRSRSGFTIARVNLASNVAPR